MDAFDIPDVTKETVTPFPAREMQVVHRFCKHIMPLPNAGFPESGTDLARQLRDMIKKPVDGLVHRRLEDRGMNPDMPYGKRVCGE